MPARRRSVHQIVQSFLKRSLIEPSVRNCFRGSSTPRRLTLRQKGCFLQPRSKHRRHLGTPSTPPGPVGDVGAQLLELLRAAALLRELRLQRRAHLRRGRAAVPGCLGRGHPLLLCVCVTVFTVRLRVVQAWLEPVPKAAQRAEEHVLVPVRTSAFDLPT